MQEHISHRTMHLSAPSAFCTAYVIPASVETQECKAELRRRLICILFANGHLTLEVSALLAHFLDNDCRSEALLVHLLGMILYSTAQLLCQSIQFALEVTLRRSRGGG